MVLPEVIEGREIESWSTCYIARGTEWCVWILKQDERIWHLKAGRTNASGEAHCEQDFGEYIHKPDAMDALRVLFEALNGYPVPEEA